MLELRQVRRDAGRSLKQVEQEVKDLTGEHIDWSTLSKVERGLAGLPDIKKVALARYYGVSVGALFFGEETDGQSVRPDGETSS